MSSTDSLPNSDGFFGDFGGRYVPEELEAVLEELTEAYLKYKLDKFCWQIEWEKNG